MVGLRFFATLVSALVAVFRRTISNRAIVLPMMIGAIVGGLCAPAMAQPYGRVDPTVEVGFSGTLKRFHWYPVRVTLRNYFDSDIEAFVTLKRRVPPNSREPRLELTQRLTMAAPPPGGPLIYTLYFYCPPIGDSGGADFTVDVRDASGTTLLRERRVREVERGGVTFEEEYWLPDETFPRHGPVRGIVRNEEAERLVVSVTNGAFPATTMREDDKGVASIRVFTIVPTEPTRLPDNWTGYDAVDALFLSNPDWNALQGEKFQAIKTWVRSGGHLILALSEKLSEFKASQLDDLAGVRLDEAGTYSGPDFLTFDGRVRLFIGSGQRLSSNPLSILKVTPLPKTRVLAARPEDGAPLILRSHPGLGTVTLFTFDPSHPNFVAQEGQSPTPMQMFMADEILLQSARERWFADVAGELVPAAPTFESSSTGYGNNYGYYGGPWGGGSRHTEQHKISLQTRLRDDATFIQKGEPPSFAMLALFIGLYVLIIGPLDYLLLGLLNLRSWTWLTFTVTVIGFFLVAEYGSEQLKGGNMSVRQISVITFDADGTVERGDLYGGVFSQANAGYEIFTNRPNSRLCPMQRGSGEIGDWTRQMRNVPRAAGPDTESGTILRISQGQNPARPGLFIENLQLPRWNIRPVQATYVDAPARHRDETLRRLVVTQNGEEWEITNATGTPIEGALLVRRTGVLVLRSARGDGWEPIPPGETRTARRQWWSPVAVDSRLISPRTMNEPVPDTDVRRTVLHLNWAEEKHGGISLLGDLPTEVKNVIAATVGDRARLFKNDRSSRKIHLERGSTAAGIDLSLALERGATVVVAWTPFLDELPPEPLRLTDHEPTFEHRTVYRVVIWPTGE